MEQRLERSLEQIILLLQESESPVEYSRLVKRLLARDADKFYSTQMLLIKLKDLGYINYNGSHIELTSSGIDFKGFTDIKYQEYLNDQEKKLNLENLMLQNENLKRQSQIDVLTVENLRLQNKQLKRYALYAVIGFIAGAILTNIKDIAHFVQLWTK